MSARGWDPVQGSIAITTSPAFNPLLSTVILSTHLIRPLVATNGTAGGRETRDPDHLRSIFSANSSRRMNLGNSPQQTPLAWTGWRRRNSKSPSAFLGFGETGDLTRCRPAMLDAIVSSSMGNKSARDVLFLFRNHIHLGRLAGRNPPTRQWKYLFSCNYAPCPKHDGRSEKASLAHLSICIKRPIWKRSSPPGQSDAGFRLGIVAGTLRDSSLLVH